MIPDGPTHVVLDLVPDGHGGDVHEGLLLAGGQCISNIGYLL